MRLAYANARKDQPAVAAAEPVRSVSKDSAPKPDVAAPAVAEPAPRRRAAKSGAALSINSILQEKQEADRAAEEAAKADEAPSDERIFEVWKTLPEHYASRPRLASMLSGVTMNVATEGDVKHICFDVATVAQQEWIEKNLRLDIEGTLARKLNYGRVKIRVGLLPQEEQPKKAYLPEEKARELMAANPELRTLVNDLNLDVK